MRRIAAWMLIAHALAHSFAGMSSWDTHGDWSSAVWTIAVVGYLSAAFGLLRLPGLRKHWMIAFVIATIASMHLLVWFRPRWGITGLAIDLALSIAILGPWQKRIDTEMAVLNAAGDDKLRHRGWTMAFWSLGALVLAYVAVVLITRPVSLEWGTSENERAMALPGDEVLPAKPTYRIDHAITIHAPPSAVWPWLMQLGQDRGGFYSYDWLERAFGARINNANRVHAEWQGRRVDDTVFATQRSYLGGHLGALGWRVVVLEPERVMGLENWGTFVLRPVDSTTTRLIVRTRGAGSPSALTFALAPLNVFLFEPVHFIMERGMLRGIRSRAEERS
jgi:hypothetical protein